jgi:membrane protease YdiL (CAAX protease family)
VTTPVSTTPSSPPAQDLGPDGLGPTRSWGAGVAFLSLLVTFGALIFVSVPVLLIGDDTPTAKAVSSFVSSLLQNAIFVAAPLLIIAMMVGGVRRRDVGLVIPRKAWIIPGVIVIALVGYLLISAGLGELLNAGNEEDDLPEKLGAKGALFNGIIVGIAVTVFAPIGEEFLLRGVLYTGLRNTFSRIAPIWVAIAAAALVDGAIFGLFHILGTKLIFLPVLATFGVILCLVYEATKTLYAGIVLHCTNNTIAITVALDWSFLGGLALWASALSILTLIALAARGVEGRLGPPRELRRSPVAAAGPPAG